MVHAHGVHVFHNYVRLTDFYHPANPCSLIMFSPRTWRIKLGASGICYCLTDCCAGSLTVKYTCPFRGFTIENKGFLFNTYILTNYSWHWVYNFYSQDHHCMYWKVHRKARDLVGWLVLGLTALWDSISVYIEPSPKEREKEEMKDRWE